MSLEHAPPLPEVLSLLSHSDLPTDDLQPGHPVRLLGWRQQDRLSGVVGLEFCGPDALLRSLAVEPASRERGLGRRLVALAEDLARDQGVRTLYLLTTTAADFFAAQGYARTDRAQLPEAVRLTPQVAGLCPASAILMSKVLRS